jgi:hypothetical protein
LLVYFTARSGTAPYNLVNPAERFETVPYNRYYMLAM